MIINWRTFPFMVLLTLVGWTAIFFSMKSYFNYHEENLWKSIQLLTVSVIALCLATRAIYASILSRKRKNEAWIDFIFFVILMIIGGVTFPQCFPGLTAAFRF